MPPQPACPDPHSPTPLCIPRQEHPLTIAVYFHLCALVSSAIPLALSYPLPAWLLFPLEMLLMLCIAVGSFGGNLLVNRAFQLGRGAKTSAVNFTQARALLVPPLVPPLRLGVAAAPGSRPAGSSTADVLSSAHPFSAAGHLCLCDRHCGLSRPHRRGRAGANQLHAWHSPGC